MRRSGLLVIVSVLVASCAATLALYEAFVDHDGRTALVLLGLCLLASVAAFRATEGTLAAVLRVTPLAACAALSFLLVAVNISLPSARARYDQYQWPPGLRDAFWASLPLTPSLIYPDGYESVVDYPQDHIGIDAKQEGLTLGYVHAGALASAYPWGLTDLSREDADALLGLRSVLERLDRLTRWKAVLHTVAAALLAAALVAGALSVLLSRLRRQTTHSISRV